MLRCVVSCMVLDVSNLETSENTHPNRRSGSSATSRSPYISQNGILIQSRSSDHMNAISNEKSQLMRLSVSKCISQLFILFSLHYQFGDFQFFSPRYLPPPFCHWYRNGRPRCYVLIKGFQWVDSTKYRDTNTTNSTQILRDFGEGTRLSDTCGSCKHTRTKW